MTEFSQGLLSTVYLPLDDIAAADRNAKEHDVPAIARAIRDLGFLDPAIIDERTGRLIGGHGRLKALKRLRDENKPAPTGIDPSGGWHVPVVHGWRSVDDEQAMAANLALNRLQELGGYDDRTLAEILTDLDDTTPDLIETAGYSAQFLEDLIASFGDADGGDGGGDGSDHDDDDTTPPEKPTTKPGDLWLCDDHRILCGSATDPAAIDLVMDGQAPDIIYTDPPYGIDIVSTLGVKGLEGAATPRDYKPVIGDKTTDTARDAFTLLHGRYPKATHVWWGANHYAAAAALPNASCWLIWDKVNDQSYFADAELAWTNHTAAVRIFRHQWHGMIRASERGERVHPNQKPVALAVWALNLIDPKRTATTVLDTFGGSGSTLLAAQHTGRQAHIIELDPAYIDVHLRRWTQATGGTPRHATTGHTWTDPQSETP